MRRRTVGAVVAGALAVAGVGACGKPPQVPPIIPTTLPGTPPPPNVVRIMTDDQDVSSLQIMAKTQRLLAAKGVSYTNSTVTLSLCCPSRATALTGQYTHNHGVWDNGGKSGGYQHFTAQDNTLAPWLRASGYTTAHVGKYMNNYTKAVAGQVPPGWDRWFNIVDEATEAYPFYGYTVSDNGVTRTYGTADEDYATDVFANRAVSELQAMEASGRPFFLDYWPTAPHYGRGRSDTTHFGPAVAPAYQDANPGVQAPRSGNFLPGADQADPAPLPLRTMGALFQMSHGGMAGFAELLDASYRDYLNSLLSVDDSVERLVNELEASGKLANTLIIFTSDNGLMWGNHGLTQFKWEPYEESLRVPLIVVGPGVPQGVTSDQPVSNIDIVPTILQATGAQAGRVLDGTSLLPYPADPAASRDRAVLVESNMYDPASIYQFVGYKVARYKGVRASGFQYTEWMDGIVELYDLTVDPIQMHNVADDPAHAGNRAALAAALVQLRDCVGAACAVWVSGLTHPGGSPETTTTSTTAPEATTTTRPGVTTTTAPEETTTSTSSTSSSTTAVPTTSDPEQTTTTTAPDIPPPDIPGMPPPGISKAVG